MVLSCRYSRDRWGPDGGGTGNFDIIFGPFLEYSHSPSLLFLSFFSLSLFPFPFRFPFLPHPNTVRVPCSPLYIWSSDADWCFESDVVTDLGLQVQLDRPALATEFGLSFQNCMTHLCTLGAGQIESDGHGCPLVICEIAKGSPAAATALECGDAIKAIDDTSVDGAELDEVVGMLAECSSVKLTVERHHRPPAARIPPVCARTGQCKLLQAHARVDCVLELDRDALRCYKREADGSKGAFLKEVCFDEPERVGEQLTVLPDYARRSRHQENLYPFHVTPLDPDLDPIKDGLLLAMDSGKSMWSWVRAIRWRGEPVELPHRDPPRLYCATTRDVNPHYDDPSVLQAQLLQLDRYPQECRRDLDDMLRTCLIGACIHNHERCVEMVLSLPGINLHQYVSGNSPLSMAVEGNYSASRQHIVSALLKQGHQVGREIEAYGGYQFSYLLAKPNGISGISSIIGEPIHDDDKQLIEFLIDKGDGADDNGHFTEAVTRVRQFPAQFPPF